MESTLYGVYTLVVLYQKSHSFASLTCSISDTPQLVCKHRTHALSMKYSILLPQKSTVISEIFGNPRKCSETFVWYSEQFWKILGNLRKVVGNLRKIIKNAVAKKIFYSLAALVRKILFCHSKIKFISSRHRVISSLSLSLSLYIYIYIYI